MRNVRCSLLLTMILTVFVLPASAADGPFRLWKISSFESGREMITFAPIDLKPSQRQPQRILDLLFPPDKGYHPKIVLIKHGIAYVNIEGDAQQITTRGGSTTPSYFCAVVVFNLTEFDNIDFVYFVDEGDHFVRGQFERLNFWNLLSDYRKQRYRPMIEQRLNPKDHLLSYYVGLLAEIGDATSLASLQELKNDMIKQGYTCIDAPIDESIQAIQNRLASTSP